jgi:hypothetical protein
VSETEQQLASSSIPQADDLDKVRSVIASLADGPRTAHEIAEATGFSLRHSEYRARAAELLGLVRRDKQHLVITSAGRALLASGEQSEGERKVWLRCFAETALAGLVPELFEPSSPDREALAARLMQATGMAESTAARRAGTLLTWRRRLASRQLSLFDDAYL